MPADDRLALAVSGGSDSMALLGAAARVAPSRVHVVHVDHGLRPEAGDDAQWVADQCARLGLPCRVVEAPPDASSPGRSETAARERRGAALALAAQGLGARWMLQAHHRDDAHETLLLHLARGHRGDRALAGIPTLRPWSGAGSGADGLRLLRPFLFGPHTPGRAELARARTAFGLGYREDRTNSDRSIPRVAWRAVLARAEPPLTHERLERLRCHARRRLERRLVDVVTRLDEQLVPEGRGARLPVALLDPAPGGDALAHRAELLRLLGAALTRPVRLIVRPSLAERLVTLAAAGHGALDLPGDDRNIRITASQAALHLPAESPAGPHPGWTALWRTPLYLS